ncbi:MAG: GtrA family protein [Verrucomicrobiota bacterium]
MALLRLLKSDYQIARQHVNEHGFQRTLVWLRSQEAPASVQFLKYVISGGVSTVVQLAFFLVLTHTVMPAHDYLGEVIDDSTKERNAILSNLIAFPFSNTCAYLLNRLFVFTPGRYNWWIEFLLFTLISFVSFGAGLVSGPILISRGLDPWIAQFGFMVTSALVNFVCRKFLIFLK